MTSRDRFNQTMSFGNADRAPWFEEGLRDEVLDRWQRQGLPPGADLSAMFRYDRRERIELDLGPRPRIKSSPLSAADLPALRRQLDSADPARLPTDWVDRVKRWRHRDHILELPLHHGLFLTLGVGDWSSLERVLYRLADAPEAAAEIMHLHGQLAADLADKVLADVEVDFASFSEPIGGNHGPLISPAMYRDIVLAGCRPILDVLRRRGVKTIAFISYANARIPAARGAGRRLQLPLGRRGRAARHGLPGSAGAIRPRPAPDRWHRPGPAPGGLSPRWNGRCIASSRRW